MPNYTNYQKSISDELLSVKNRVRDFIGSNHWGEEGRYKEIILSNVINRLLPPTISVGTGFVMCGTTDRSEDLTTQIDIIVYDNSCPVLFSMENFVIVPHSCVLGIIEVKSRLTHSNFKETIEKAHLNGMKIKRNNGSSKRLFNGIFAYESDFNFSNALSSTIIQTMKDNYGSVNHIAFNSTFFLKHWSKGQPSAEYSTEHYSTYGMKDLAFGYFISNLIEYSVVRQSGRDLPFITRRAMYPVANGKEFYRVSAFEIERNDEPDPID